MLSHSLAAPRMPSRAHASSRVPTTILPRGLRHYKRRPSCHLSRPSPLIFTSGKPPSYLLYLAAIVSPLFGRRRSPWTAHLTTPSLCAGPREALPPRKALGPSGTTSLSPERRRASAKLPSRSPFGELPACTSSFLSYSRDAFLMTPRLCRTSRGTSRPSPPRLRLR
jgi:hypothetical protein